MRTFLVVWSGQLVSIVGTNLTAFALAIFVFQETGSATQLAGILLASQLPQVLFTPIAGALVDRWDRRWAMILSDTGAGLGTVTIAVLLMMGSLEIWHLYVILPFLGDLSVAAVARVRGGHHASRSQRGLHPCLWSRAVG